MLDEKVGLRVISTELLGDAPLWREAVPGTWSDVCGFVKPTWILWNGAKVARM